MDRSTAAAANIMKITSRVGLALGRSPEQYLHYWAVLGRARHGTMPATNSSTPARRSLQAERGDTPERYLASLDMTAQMVTLLNNRS